MPVVYESNDAVLEDIGWLTTGYLNFVCLMIFKFIRTKYKFLYIVGI